MLVRRFRRGRRTIAHIRAVSIVVLCVIGLLGFAFFRCRPVLQAFAESQAVWIATKIANQTASDVLSEYKDDCADMIVVIYDGQQKVSAVETDSSAVNAVRTAMTDQAITAMEAVTSLPVSIPLGTLTGWHWISGWGPLITFPISFTATVISGVSSSLIAEGINQSTYRVEIGLEIALLVVSPVGRTTVSASVSYPMAEAVILGEVPDNLTEVYGDDQSLLGQIFDYGTIQ